MKESMNHVNSNNLPKTPSLASSYQVGGDHYKAKKIQPWTAMQAWLTPEEFEGFLRGNVIKYIARYKDKDGLKDVYKAKHYLERLVELLEESSRRGEDSCGK
jgi:hypothetical protein